MSTIAPAEAARPAPDAITDPGLRAELDAIEADYPGWVLWLSEQGSIWIQAVTGIMRWAPTPALARHAIAVWEHQADLRWAA